MVKNAKKRYPRGNKKCKCCGKKTTSPALYRTEPVCRRCYRQLRDMGRSKFKAKRYNDLQVRKFWGKYNGN